MAGAFEGENGSIVCRELLGLDRKKDVPVPEQRTGEYYKKRPCGKIVHMAAAIMEEYIKDAHYAQGKIAAAAAALRRESLASQTLCSGIMASCHLPDPILNFL